MNTVLSTFFKLAAASIMPLTDGSTRMLIGAVFVAMTRSSVYLLNTQFKWFLRVVNRYTLFFGAGIGRGGCSWLDCDRSLDVNGVTD
jgi:multidrug transporter EmrE-like cation transporter